MFWICEISQICTNFYRVVVALRCLYVVALRCLCFVFLIYICSLLYFPLLFLKFLKLLKLCWMVLIYLDIHLPVDVFWASVISLDSNKHWLNDFLLTLDVYLSDYIYIWRYWSVYMFGCCYLLTIFVKYLFNVRCCLFRMFSVHQVTSYLVCRSAI
jgi:hypothetical protein